MVQRLEKTLIEHLAAATGQTIESVRADMLADRHFTANEARGYGLIDGIDP